MKTVTTLGLAVLRLLDERPHHPYEMQLRMREQGIDTLIKVTRGALYHTVDVLTRAELITPRETSREGRRPERTVYAITDAGRDTVRDRLRELLSTLAPEYPSYCVALAFMSVLPMADASARLDQRCLLLEAELASVTTSYEALRKRGTPPIHIVEIRHLQAHLRADLDLTRALVTEIGDGLLEWVAQEDDSSTYSASESESEDDR